MSNSQPDKLLIAFGNPLLDILVHIDEKEESELVEKHNLLLHLGQETETCNILRDLEAKEKQFVPGGCALNTCRVLRWLDPKHEIDIKFYGGVGNDSKQQILQDLVSKDGINCKFAVHVEEPTGHCLALVYEEERTLCASLGACRLYDLEDLVEIAMDIGSARVIYVTSFFAHHSFEVTEKIIDIGIENGRQLIFNLSGEYTCQDKAFVEKILRLLPRFDFIFGNKGEFNTLLRTLAELGKEIPFTRAMKNLLNDSEPEFILIPLSTSEKSCTLVLSHGPEPIYCGTIVGSELTSKGIFKVPKMNSSEIKDTIGAGDSFVAGFLQGIICGKTLGVCIENGIYAAQTIIKENGTQLPKTLNTRYL